MSSDEFRRYTNLPVLLDILNKKRLTLLDPRNWDDKNDSYFIEIYKERLKLKSVLALCFAIAPETYHHWKVFSGDPSGVCIIFDKDNLLECFSSEEFEHRPVEYPLLNEIKNNSVDLRDLPFIKRYGFIDENEYRIIYKDKVKVLFSKAVSIPINCISRIVINPWMPSSVFFSVRSVIRRIEGCQRIKIDRTTLVDNETWKKIGRDIKQQ